MRLGLMLRLVGEMVANNELLEDTRSLVDTVGGEGRGPEGVKARLFTLAKPKPGQGCEADHVWEGMPWDRCRPAL